MVRESSIPPAGLETWLRATAHRLMTDKGWSRLDLENHSDLSQSTIHFMLSGDRAGAVGAWDQILTALGSSPRDWDDAAGRPHS